MLALNFRAMCRLLPPMPQPTSTPCKKGRSHIELRLTSSFRTSEGRPCSVHTYMRQSGSERNYGEAFRLNEHFRGEEESVTIGDTLKYYFTELGIVNQQARVKLLHWWVNSGIYMALNLHWDSYNIFYNILTKLFSCNKIGFWCKYRWFDLPLTPLKLQPTSELPLSYLSELDCYFCSLVLLGNSRDACALPTCLPTMPRTGHRIEQCLHSMELPVIKFNAIR